MHPRHARLVLAVSLFLFVAAQVADAGRGHFERRAQRKGWDYPKLTGYTFIEDGLAWGRLTLCANVELAMFRLEDPFLPLQFVVASEERPLLSVTPDRFHLVLPDGSTLKPVPFRTLTDEGYRSELTLDWSRRRSISVTHGFFRAGYRRIASQFYPDPAGRAIAVKIDAWIGDDDYVEDALYFRNPGGLAGRELRLVYEDPDSGPGVETERRIEVVFVIPDPRPGGGRQPQGRPEDGP
jgi:hypothetical protein